MARRLVVQERDAVWWKDACLLYFGDFSGQPIPVDVSAPVHTLPELKAVNLGISNHESPSAELLNRVR